MDGVEEAPMMLARPRTIDEYLSPLSTEKRAALGKLRETIRSIIPEAEECITYGIPPFRLAGVVVAGFCATAKESEVVGDSAPVTCRHVAGLRA
jgi:uncharacterized protein YdhG (YjbR/CyaY superfamily)